METPLQTATVPRPRPSTNSSFYTERFDCATTECQPTPMVGCWPTFSSLTDAASTTSWWPRGLRWFSALPRDSADSTNSWLFSGRPCGTGGAFGGSVPCSPRPTISATAGAMCFIARNAPSGNRPDPATAFDSNPAYRPWKPASALAAAADPERRKGG